MQVPTGMQVPANTHLITIGSLTALGDMMYSMNAPDSSGGGTPGVQSLSAAVETTDAVTPLVGIETTDAVTPLVAVATAQPGLAAGESAVALAAVGQASSSLFGSTPSALQAIDATILGWKVGIVCRRSQKESRRVLPSSAKGNWTVPASGFLDAHGFVT